VQIISSPSVHNIQTFTVKHVVKHAQRFKGPFSEKIPYWEHEE